MLSCRLVKSFFAWLINFFKNLFSKPILKCGCGELLPKEYHRIIFKDDKKKLYEMRICKACSDLLDKELAVTKEELNEEGQ